MTGAERDVLVMGETLVDFIPERPGPLSSVEGFRRRPGGAPANVAVALSRLGRTPAFWTRVGDDPFGAYLRGVLREEGLSDALVERDPDAPTTLAFVTHDEAGDRAFSFYRDGTADTRMDPADLPRAALDAAEWVVCGGVTLAGGRSREATRRLLRRAGDAACAFDPNYRPELWPGDDFAAVVGDALGDVDVLKATEDELRALGVEGDDAAALAAAATERGPHTVLVTRGGDGALAHATAEAPWGSGTVEHAGYRVDAVDATGAGDAFLAGGVDALVGGEDLDAAVRRANAVAALATTAGGAMAALPTRDEVEAFLGGAP